MAMELIGEVFSVGGDEVKRMIKERMAQQGHDQGTQRESWRTMPRKMKHGAKGRPRQRKKAPEELQKEEG